MLRFIVVSFLVVGGIFGMAGGLSYTFSKLPLWDDTPTAVQFDCEPDFQVSGGAAVSCTDGTQVEIFGQACDRVIQQGGTLTFFCERNVIRVVRPERSTVVK